MTPPRLWLVRHGQTDWNAEGRIQGHTQTDLNTVGREQARQLARYFAARPHAFEAIYSSDLKRALTTAEIIGEAIHLPVATTPDLRERALGPYEGKSSDEVRTLRAKAMHGSPGSGDLADWTGVPGVESDDQVWSRTLAALDDISARHTVDSPTPADILIVTHGGVIARVVHQTLGIPSMQKRRFSLANGIVTIVQFIGDDLFMLSHAELPLLFDGTSTSDTATTHAKP